MGKTPVSLTRPMIMLILMERLRHMTASKQAILKKNPISDEVKIRFMTLKIIVPGRLKAPDDLGVPVSGDTNAAVAPL